MTLTTHTSRLVLAFASGAFCVLLLQASPLKASGSTLSGTCVGVWNNSTWGWPTQAGTEIEYNALDVINFDTKVAQTIVNSARSAGPVSGRPAYQQGEVETSQFRLEPGPMTGTYKLVATGEKGTQVNSTDYVLMTPANGGNTIFMVDTRNGATGVCQRV